SLRPANKWPQNGWGGRDSTRGRPWRCSCTSRESVHARRRWWRSGCGSPVSWPRRRRPGGMRRNPQFSSCLRSVQRLVEIPDDIFDIFQADRETNHVVGDAAGNLLLVAELLVGGGGGMDHQALGVADVGEV